MNIDKMLTDLLRVEGGYVNDPRDAGGETNWGITIGTARSNGYTGPMKDMTKAQALDIYRQQYFFKPGFGLVFNEAPSVAAELFDTGVNMGPTVAAKFLQRSLNALNNEGKHYADLKVDGQIGPATIKALSALVARRGLDDTEDMLLKMLNCLQGARYIELAEARSANEAFIWGWFQHRVGMPV
jgi:lysozyme family protein